MFHSKSDRNFSLKFVRFAILCVCVCWCEFKISWYHYERSESLNLKKEAFLHANRVIRVGTHIYVCMCVYVIEECRSKWFTIQNSTIIHLMRLIPLKCKLSKKKMETVWCMKAEMLYNYMWYGMCVIYSNTHTCAANTFTNFRNSSGFRMFVHNIPIQYLFIQSLFCRNHKMLSNTFQPTAQLHNLNAAT